MAGKTRLDEIRVEIRADMNGQPDILFAASTSPSPSAKYVSLAGSSVMDDSLCGGTDHVPIHACVYPTRALRYFPFYVIADDMQQCKNTGRNKE